MIVHCTIHDDSFMSIHVILHRIQEVDNKGIDTKIHSILKTIITLFTSRSHFQHVTDNFS
jgi:hypothetical protein